jgi:hypothetical protein
MNIYSICTLFHNSSYMPNRDGTGPNGEGPGTGRGLGPCGKGAGRGRGMGMRGRLSNTSLEDTVKALEKRIEDLENK